MSQAAGALHADISRVKDLADYWLTRFPKLYALIEKRRRWLNWDRRLYLSLVQRGDVILDVGANVGAHTVLFSHLAGKEGRVIAFEPVPANFVRLRETVDRRTRFANVTMRDVAVGNPLTSGEHVSLAAPGEDLTQASIRIQSAGSWQEGADVRRYCAMLTSIDTEMGSMPAARLDFMKIDVEGAELDVLKGSTQAIARFEPLIYAEVFAAWTRSFGYGPKDLFDFLGAAGYTEARVIQEHGVIPLRLDGDDEFPDFSVSSNTLFFGERHRARVRRFDRFFEVKGGGERKGS